MPTYEIVPMIPDVQSAPVYLFGETHLDQLCYDAELWMLQQCYAKGLRHLFYEMASYAAEEINLWMHADDDTILHQLFEDWRGTLGASANHFAWFKEIKKKFPELIFHGVDIDAFYNTTGARYLARLKGHEDSEDYRSTTLTMTLGQSWHDAGGGINAQREYFMFVGFERELETLWRSDKDARIFGIFGKFHTDILQENNLINMLRKKYGEIFQVWVLKNKDIQE